MTGLFRQLIDDNSEGLLVAFVVATIFVGLFSTIIVGIIYTSEQEKCLTAAWRMRATVEYNSETNTCKIGPRDSIDKISVE